MEIIYRSFDGLEFSDEEPCRAHEQNNPHFIMFDDKGVTNDADMAYVVDIRDDCGTEFFVKLCEQEYTTSEGISEDDIAGVYIWNDLSCEYIKITDRVLQAIEQYIKFKKG